MWSYVCDIPPPPPPHHHHHHHHTHTHNNEAQHLSADALPLCNDYFDILILLWEC